jgi:hypothetical protein
MRQLVMKIAFGLIVAFAGAGVLGAQMFYNVMHTAPTILGIVAVVGGLATAADGHLVRVGRTGS